MKKLMAIAAATMLAGCITIEDKGFNLIRERRVDITTTGYESLPPGRYRLMIEAQKYTPTPTWYKGWLNVSETRQYTFGCDDEEGK